MKNLHDFKKMKKADEKIVMLTAYDYVSGQIAEMCDVDIILVGDSLGMVVQGNKTTIGVTLSDMIYHAKAVRKGSKDTFMIVDMPYMSYHLDIDKTIENAAKIMIETEANAVKIEGGSSARLEVINVLTDCEIPVCAHLGLTPQSINMLGGYHVQAKNKYEQDELFEKAYQIQDAGAFMLVLECVPEGLGNEIAEELSIPVIGIGAGRHTDGQVLVWHDIFGLSDMTPKFAKQYKDIRDIMHNGIKQFVTDVRGCEFPNIENVFKPKEKSNVKARKKSISPLTLFPEG